MTPPLEPKETNPAVPEPPTETGPMSSDLVASALDHTPVVLVNGLKAREPLPFCRFDVPLVVRTRADEVALLEVK